jgi:hypothetical protein
MLPHLARYGHNTPFVSVGANLGVHARFDGNNAEGRGRGTATVSVSSTLGADELTTAFGQMGDLPFVSFEGATMDRANWSTATGASRWPLSYGFPVINLLARDFDRFHLPSDGEGSVNVTALNALTMSVAEALQAYMCSGTC